MIDRCHSWVVFIGDKRNFKKEQKKGLGPQETKKHVSCFFVTCYTVHSIQSLVLLYSVWWSSLVGVLSVSLFRFSCSCCIGYVYFLVFLCFTSCPCFCCFVFSPMFYVHFLLVPCFCFSCDCPHVCFTFVISHTCLFNLWVSSPLCQFIAVCPVFFWVVVDVGSSLPFFPWLLCVSVSRISSLDLLACVCCCTLLTSCLLTASKYLEIRAQPQRLVFGNNDVSLKKSKDNYYLFIKETKQIRSTIRFGT